jgi:hypothetical protein
MSGPRESISTPWLTSFERMLGIQCLTLASRMTAFAHQLRGSLCRLATSTAKALTLFQNAAARRVGTLFNIGHLYPHFNGVVTRSHRMQEQSLPLAPISQCPVARYGFRWCVRLKTNECNTGCRVNLFLKVPRAFCHDNFAGRPNSCAQQVATVGSAVSPSDHKMGMNLRHYL